MERANRIDGSPGNLIIRFFQVTLLLGAFLTSFAVRLLASDLDGAQTFTVRVTDVSGKAMPGIDVSLLRNGQMLEKVTTDSDGRASLRIDLGVVTISIHQPAYLASESTVDTKTLPSHVLEVQLTPAPQVRETVTVQATNQDITEQSASPGAEIKPAEANESPLRPLTLTDALPLVPGVVRAPNGQIQIEGAGEMHSALIVNSIDVTDPATGQFGLSVPIDVVGSLHVMTTPYLTQYGRFSAGVVTADTKPGGNKWHYDLNDPFPEFRIRSGHLRGLKSATPRFSFGGPIVKDRSSFSEALEFVDNKIPIRTLPFPFNETKILSLNSFTQADFALSPRQTLTASFHDAPRKISYARLDSFDPQEVTPNGNTASQTGVITHRLAIGQGLLQSTIAASDIQTTVSPQGDLGMLVSPTGNSGNYFANEERHSRRFDWNEMWSFRPITRFGQHKLDIGSSIGHTGDDGQLNAKTVTLSDAQGTKIRTINFSSGGSFNRGDVQSAFFFQDHWTLNSHLAIDAGVRREAQSITGTFRFAPRTGFIWYPDSAGRTNVRGGIGVFYDSVPLNVYSFSHYPQQTITNFLPNGSIDGAPQRYLNLTAANGSSHFAFVDRDQKIGSFAPYTIAWSLEVEHQVSDRLTLRAKYLESKGNGLITISPQVVQGQNAFVIDGNGTSLYRQFELTARLTLQPHFPIYSSYVRSLSKGYLNESDTYLGDFSSPFIRNNLYTNRAGDLPNRFLTWGSVDLPWKMKVYPMIELRSGFPYQPLDVYQNYVQNSKSKSLRFPAYFAADIRVARDVKLNAKYTLRPSISVTNITNHFNAIEVHANTADPQYGRFFGNYDRHERFDLDVVF